MLKRTIIAGLVLIFIAVSTAAFAGWKFAGHTLLGSPLYDATILPDRVQVATEAGLITLDENGKELNRHSVDTTTCYVVLADNSRYGVVEHRPRVPQFPERITLFNDGETIATFPIDGAPYLAPNGDWLVTTNRYTKTVAVYNERGGLLREDTCPQVQNASISFADNNQTVLINLPLSPTRGITVSYDRLGRRLFKVENQLGIANSSLSVSGRRAAIIGRTAAVIYTDTGAVQQTIPRGLHSGLGMMTRDGKELWLTEGEGFRVIALDTGDSRAVTIAGEKGEIVKLADEPSGRYILIGQRTEGRETGTVWTWRVIERANGNELWLGEERQRVSYAVLGPASLIKGTDEIEFWKEAQAIPSGVE